MKIGYLAAAAVGSALFLTACAGATPTETGTATPQVTVTVTQTPEIPTQTTPAAEPETTKPATTKPESTASTPASTPKTKKPQAKKAPAIVTVPDAVGKNYQRAQDLWRSRGLVVLPAEDASGKDRLPWIDSGWYVVDQDPPAGTRVEDGSTIQATILKYTD